MAFSQNVNPSYIKQPQNGKVQILPADTTALKTVLTAGASGSKVTSLIATNTDSANARVIQIFIVNGGTNYCLGTINVPLNAGFASGVNAVNLLDPTIILGLPLDSDGNPYINLISGDTLQAASLTTVAAGKAINVIAATAGDF